MSEKALTIKSAWLKQFGGVGLIQVIGQRAERGTNEAYRASNGMVICSSNTPDINEGVFYIRGLNEKQDLKILATQSFEVYQKILTAVEEFNKVHEKSSVDLLSLHVRLWERLAETGSKDKLMFVRELTTEAGIPTPHNSCFLCEDVQQRKVTCKECHGYWGENADTCLSYGSYFMMWELEEDIELRKALAKRIANNLETDTVLAHELEIAFTEGKIEAIKKYKARTGRGLRESKDAIEFAMMNGR